MVCLNFVSFKSTSLLGILSSNLHPFLLFDFVNLQI